MDAIDARVMVIGCGGIGGWLVSCLGRTIKSGAIILVDADTVEEHNLDRQLFSTGDIGQPKADVMAHLLARTVSQDVDIESIVHWFPDSNVNWGEVPDAIFVAVDNHPARKAVLEYLDLHPGCQGFFAANGLLDADAYYYDSTMLGSSADPRVQFPEIETDTSENRLAPPCTGEVQERHPQLAAANMLAAAYAMYLWWHHRMVLPSIKDSSIRGACALSRVFNTSSRVASATIIPRK